MKKEWFSTWFDSPYYPMLYKGRDEAEARAFIDALLGALHLSPGARVLDLACGRGRHSVQLAERGFEVVGLDISENSIADAKAHEAENLSFYVHDMRRLFRPHYFDAIFNLFTSFGYFASEREHRGVIATAARQLRPGGIFVLDFFNAEKVVAKLVPSGSITVQNVVFDYAKTVENGYIVKRIQVQDGPASHRYEERVRAYVLADFEEMFAAAGLRIKATFGDYALSPFVPAESDRLVLWGEKAA